MPKKEVEDYKAGLKKKGFKDRDIPTPYFQVENDYPNPKSKYGQAMMKKYKSGKSYQELYYLEHGQKVPANRPMDYAPSMNTIEWKRLNGDLIHKDFMRKIYGNDTGPITKSNNKSLALGKTSFTMYRKSKKMA